MRAAKEIFFMHLHLLSKHFDAHTKLLRKGDREKSECMLLGLGVMIQKPPWELMIYQPYMAKLSENEVSLSC